MDTKLAALALIAIVATVGVVYAIQQQVWINPHDAQVGVIEITRILEDTVVGNDTIDWGIIYPNNIYSYNWTVTNNVDTIIRVWYEPFNLPPDWTLTWTANNTLLDPQQSVSGWLDLYVPLSAVNGSYSWEGHTKAEYT